MKTSVCMAVHNGALYLMEQIDSILPQLGPADELVISDDNSSDESVEIIKSYRDERVRILAPRQFGNPVRNFEYLLTNCEGDNIFLSDQDDVWHPEKINKMKVSLQTHDLVVCDCSLVDNERNIKVDSFFEFNQVRSGLVRNLIRNSFVGCCMAFKRNLKEAALPFPKGIPMHDQWIGLLGLRSFSVKFLPEVLVEHRLHQRNYSTTGRATKNSWNNKVISRLRLTQMLLKR
ncbi:MAG: glycosyltransferase family 2 protein [Bacteroidetes bacterium]|nr:glycosyltransferase family 2 protein [Bacteroidota bacterium]